MRKILVIEDDENIRESLVELLEMRAYNLLSAGNGEVGLELAKSSVPDLILCDVMMPGLTGYEVIEQIRRTAELQKVPFVFLSAKAMETDIQKGIDLGANLYLTKPFKAQELFSVVDKLLNDNRGGGGGTGLGNIMDRLQSVASTLRLVFRPGGWQLI